MMFQIFLVCLAFIATVQGRPVGMESVDTGVKPQIIETLYNFSLRIDYGTVNNKTCKDFFSESQLNQTRAPARAYRYAVRKVLMEIASSLQISNFTVPTVSIVCDDPPRPNLKMKRIRLTAALSPLGAMAFTNIMTKYPEAEDAGDVHRALMSKGGPKFSWQELYIQYKASTGAFAICQLGTVYCASAPWNPKKVTLYQPPFMN